MNAGRGRSRANGEGSIFPYRNGYAAYVWVTTPAGTRKRAWAYGRTRDEVHTKWLRLHADAKAGAVATKSLSVRDYLAYWLSEVVTEPDYSPKTISTYEGHIRLHIAPSLGAKRLSKLTVRDLRVWLNDVRNACQCCAQGKDARRPASKRRCCAIGACCGERVSERTAQDILMVLRSALSNAVREELIVRNPATLLRIAKPRRNRKVPPWSVAEAQTFLASARGAMDALYAAYVLILVLGLRKGEVLGLTWELIDLDKAELFVSEQLQRVGRKLLRRQVKTEASEAPLPLPGICVTALKLRKQQQERNRARYADQWSDTGLVFTTRYGTPIEPRNFNRSFDYRIRCAGVRRITVHGTRKTCGTLLAALDVHPRVAMQILRHSRFSVTMEIYTEVTSEATRAALKRLGDELDGSTCPT